MHFNVTTLNKYDVLKQTEVCANTRWGCSSEPWNRGVRQQNTLEAGYVRDIMRSETLICTYNRILACLIDSNEYESICIGDIHTWYVAMIAVVNKSCSQIKLKSILRRNNPLKQ